MQRYFAVELALERSEQQDNKSIFNLLLLMFQIAYSVIILSKEIWHKA